MNELTSIDALNAKPLARPAGQDARLLELHGRYLRALAARDRAGDKDFCARRFGPDISKQHSLAIRLCGRARKAILETPAEGPAGIAVKLGILGALLDWEQIDAVGAAFADAARLAGIEPAQLRRDLADGRELAA